MEVLPSGVLFYGTELIPLFPYLRAGLLLKREGGGRSTDGSTLCDRMMIFDHSLKGYRPQVFPGLKEFLS